MSEGHRSGVSELYVFSRPKHYKEGPVRGVSFAASDNETAFCKKYHRCTKHRKHLVDKNLMRHY